MRALTTFNGKPAALDRRDGLIFALGTTPPSGGKDDDDVDIHHDSAHVQPR